MVGGIKQNNKASKSHSFKPIIHIIPKKKAYKCNMVKFEPKAKKNV